MFLKLSIAVFYRTGPAQQTASQKKSEQSKTDIHLETRSCDQDLKQQRFYSFIYM